MFTYTRVADLHRYASVVDRTKVLMKRLIELRAGLGLDEPDLPVLPEDPLCAAFWIWKGNPPEKRRELLIGRLRYRIEQLEDERVRAAVVVAYRLHPDYQQEGNLDRRKAYAKKLRVSAETVRRDEEKGFQRIANDLVNDLADDPIFLFGRKTKNVYMPFNRPMAKCTAWILVIGTVLFIAAIGFATGMWVMWHYQMVPLLGHLK